VLYSSFFSPHFCLSVVQGIFCPMSEFVFLALSLDLLEPSIQQDNPGPAFLYPALSHSSSVVSTPSLDPSSPATTYCGMWPANWQSVQTLGLSQVKSSIDLDLGVE
jgi:hypothetical protein